MRTRNEDGVVWFDPFQWFGWLLGVLSFSHLVSKAYNIGFGPVLRGLLGAYEAALARVTVVFEPGLRQLLEAFRVLFDWRIELHSHWKHVFVLLTVYFAARYTSAFKRRQWGAAWLMVVTGLVAAVFAGIGAGAVPLSSQPDEFRINVFAMTLVPSVAILFFDSIEIVWTSSFRLQEMRRALGKPDLTNMGAFRHLLRNVAIRFLGALAIIAAVIAASYLSIGLTNAQSPGLTLLLVLSLLMGCYWVFQGMITAHNRSDKESPWLDAFQRAGSTRVGWAIIRYMALGLATVIIGWWLWDAHGVG
jgi:hypothetical protein